MKKLNLILMIVTLFQITQLYAKEKRELTLYGKIDPRLYASVVSVYRSFDPYEIEQTEENKECFRNDWNTSTRKRTLGYELAYITPDKEGNYKTIIPIDYTGDNPCGYEYVSTELRIKRDKREEDFVNIVILGYKKLSNYRTDGSGSVGVKTIKTDKKYLQLSSGTKIKCHTKHFQGISRRTKEFEEHTNFMCEPIVANEHNGVDVIKSVSLNLDIIISEKSFLYDSPDPKKLKAIVTTEKFREYKEAPTFFEKIKNFFK